MQQVLKRLFDNRGLSSLQIGAALASVVVIGLLTGLAVRALRGGGDEQPKKPAVVQVLGTKVKEEVTATPKDFTAQAVVPAGFTKYQDKIAGFSFAYPSSWGKLEAGEAVYQTADVTRFGSGLHGRLQAQAYEFGALFRPVPYRSGFTLRPTFDRGSIDWQIVKVTKTYDGYTLGAAYPAKVVRVIDGVKIYEFATTTNGVATSMFVFANPKGYFVSLTMPELSKAYDYDNHPIPGDKHAYIELKKQILQSIQIGSLVQ